MGIGGENTRDVDNLPRTRIEHVELVTDAFHKSYLNLSLRSGPPPPLRFGEARAAVSRRCRWGQRSAAVPLPSLRRNVPAKGARMLAACQPASASSIGTSRSTPRVNRPQVLPVV